MGKPISCRNVHTIVQKSIKRIFEFYYDASLKRWLGSVIATHPNQPATIHELITFRKARKTWVHLDGCIKFSLEADRNCEIIFKIPHEDRYVQFSAKIDE